LWYTFIITYKTEGRIETIGISQAKVHFTDYVRAASQGMEFLITSRGEAVAMLTPVKRRHSPEAVQECLDRLAGRRSGPVKKPGESWNDFAREGLS
jgi:prevent-host-death family protein